MSCSRGHVESSGKPWKSYSENSGQRNVTLTKVILYGNRRNSSAENKKKTYIGSSKKYSEIIRSYYCHVLQPIKEKLFTGQESGFTFILMIIRLVCLGKQIIYSCIKDFSPTPSKLKKKKKKS